MSEIEMLHNNIHEKDNELEYNKNANREQEKKAK